MASSNTFCDRVLSDLKAYWKPLVVLITPFLLSPLVFSIGTPEAKCAYVVMLMAVYWMTEALPLAVTSLLPLILYPALGVLKATKTSEQYLKDSNMVFFGSLLTALAVEESQMHRRLALLILLRIGCSPRRLMLGFTISAGFLSMWMSNTAATAMMVPLAMAIIEELPDDIADDDDKEKQKSVPSTQQSGNLPTSISSASLIDSLDDVSSSKASFNTTLSTNNDNKSIKDAEEGQTRQRSPALQRACKGVLLAICYGANIGGTGTLTGTASNIVLAGQLDSLYHSKQTGITFASWMAFAVPQMIVLLFLAWLWLTTLFVGFKSCASTKKNGDDAAKSMLSKKLEELGKMRFIEKMTLLLLLTLIFLWLFREPGFMPGWASLFPQGSDYVTDGTVAMLIGSLFFFVPREPPRFVTCFPRKTPTLIEKQQQWHPLLTWSTMQKKFSWNVLLILGGGYAMAAGVEQSGLDDWISSSLASVQSIPKLGFVVIITLVVTFLTEFSSNAAIASVFIPIGASMAEFLHINPLNLIVPITVACSFAFMLPAATPPNSIVFVAGLLRVVDMALAGFVMNLACVAVLLLNINTYGYWLFDLGTYPSWVGDSTILPVNGSLVVS